jgi:5-methylcytosine-specific restriction endonuclease McrA
MKLQRPKHDLGNRPICEVDGCNNECQLINKRKDGSPIWRKLCSAHHHEKCAGNKGVTVTEWSNSFHPYRKHRKGYCENRDGRLGFECNYEIRFSGQLQVDHMDGNPYNDNPDNLQTLCANCHIFKTFQFGDNMTAGRKLLKTDYYRNYKEVA